MRFFWTGNFKSLKPIRIAILLFILFVFLFWVGNFVYFGFEFGYSIDKIGNYFFGDSEFPVEVSVSQLAENLHVNLFVFSLLFLCISALLIYTVFSEEVKIFLILSFALIGFLYSVSDFLVFYLGRDFAFLKLVLFFIFQITLFLTTLAILFKGSNGKRNNGFSKSLAIIIFIFAFINLLFVVFNIILFASKIGFKVSDVINYHLGNPQKFIKPKSIHGLIEVSYFHFLPMALYLTTISHFIFLVSDKFNIAITVSLFLSALLDNISGIFIVLFWSGFAIVKLFSFYLLQILLLLCSVILIYKLLALKFNFPNRGRI